MLFELIVILAELQDVQKFGFTVAQVLHPGTGHAAAEKIGLVWPTKGLVVSSESSLLMNGDLASFLTSGRLILSASFLLRTLSLSSEVQSENLLC